MDILLKKIEKGRKVKINEKNAYYSRHLSEVGIVVQNISQTVWVRWPNDEVCWYVSNQLEILSDDPNDLLKKLL